MSPAARRQLVAQLGAAPRRLPADLADGPAVAGRLPARRAHHPAAAARYVDR